MNELKHLGAGCSTCPAIKKCTSMTYRGSSCKTLRDKYGLDDPMTVADALEQLSIPEKAKLLASFFTEIRTVQDIEAFLMRSWRKENSNDS